MDSGTPFLGTKSGSSEKRMIVPNARAEKQVIECHNCMVTVLMALKDANFRHPDRNVMIFGL